MPDHEDYILNTNAWINEKKEHKRSQDRIRKLSKQYGITVEDYNRKLLAQNGVCRICHLPPKSNRRLVVDHNHTSGQVRGLLCSNCNTAIGLLWENVTSMKRAIAYLESVSLA